MALSPWPATLREWQTRALSGVLAHMHSDFLATATSAVGKTRFAMEARDYHGAVVTYQQICLAPEVFQRACRRRPTLLIFDELHHAGEGKDWGNALREACEEAVLRLAFSDTPFRSDDNPGSYVRYEQGESKADFTYGYAEAIRKSVCRPIRFPSYEGELAGAHGGREHRATFEDGLTLDLKPPSRLYRSVIRSTTRC